jgi:hypothetical protein
MYQPEVGLADWALFTGLSLERPMKHKSKPGDAEYTIIAT